MDIGIKVLACKIYNLQIKIISIFLISGSKCACSAKSFSGFPDTVIETVSVALVNMWKHIALPSTYICLQVNLQ